MIHIKIIMTIILMQLFCINVCAEKIMVGEQPIEVIYPEGFSKLTPNMSPYYEALSAYIAPGKVRFTSLVPTKEGQAMLAGEQIDLDRYINIETAKTTANVSVSRKEYEGLAEYLRTQIVEAYKSAEEQIPEVTKEGTRKLSEKFDKELDFSAGDIIPLPVHLDVENMIAHSIYMTVRGNVEGEETEPVVTSVTTLVVYVKKKVLFVYIAGAKEDLIWTQQTAQKLGEEVLLANSPNKNKRQRKREKNRPE